jgi:UDP-N-acetylmuramoyl-tripeptide--D-alanyl-D-alanine ligase
MKIFLRQFLKLYLKFFAKTALLVHKPFVIAVAGSTNKYFTKKAIEKELKSKGFEAMTCAKSFNTEIGLSLSILNLSSGYNSYKNWLPTITSAPVAVFKKIPKFLIIEMGVSDRGDMRYLLSIVKPKIIVITDISQRYKESFESMDKLVSEYQYLVEKIKKEDCLIFNKDNKRINLIAEKSRAINIGFSIKNKSDYKAEKIEKTSKGLKFELNKKGKGYEYNINKFGDHHIYSFLVAKIIGDCFK